MAVPRSMKSYYGPIEKAMIIIQDKLNGKLNYW